MSLLLQDTLGRSDVAANSWGIGTDGHPWTNVEYISGSYDVSSQVARVYNNGSSNGTTFLYGSHSRNDGEILAETSLSQVNSATHSILRWQNAGNYYYAGQDLNGVMAIKKRSGGVGAVIVSSANVLTANQKYWIRFRVVGSTLYLRMWQDGTTEPSTWGLTTTDSSYPGGAFGYRASIQNLTSDTASLYSFQYADFGSLPTNQLCYDTFTRADQSGFGTGSDGQPWVQKDANATLSILSNRGKATSFAASSSNVVLGGAAIYDSDMKVRFSVSAHGTDAMFFIARWKDVNNFYFIGFLQDTLVVRKIVSGSTTTITSTASAAINNTNYWLRTQVQGTSIKLKKWADGSNEPGTWDITTTDSALTQGNPGLRLFGGASDIVLVDTLTINDFSTVSSASSVFRSRHKSFGFAQ